MSDRQLPFSETVLDHFLNPRNDRILVDPDISIEQVNDICGDRMVVTVRLKNGTIGEIGFRSFGCAVAVASASLLTEAVAGKTPQEAAAAAEIALAETAAGTLRDKRSCVEMVRRAWQRALAAIQMRIEST